MKTRFMLLAAFVLSLPVIACQPAVEETATTEADVEALNTLRDDCAAAFRAGDVEGFIALVTDDAVMMPPDEPALTGKKAIRAWTQAFFDQFTLEPTISVEEVEVLGDWAFERATNTFKLIPVAGGEVASETFKYVRILQRQPDGSWKIAREIWNRDSPPPEM